MILVGDKNTTSGLLTPLSSRDINLADPETEKETTGYEISSSSPFRWQLQVFHSLVDACLMNKELLGVSTGAWDQEIMITQ